MENQESSVNAEAITSDDINMEDIVDTSTQKSSDKAEKAIGMNKSQITALALNLLSTNSMIRSTGIRIPEMKPCILCKQKFISHPDEPIKEFTMATCGCLYHQKCLEGYILNIAKTRVKLICPNWDCRGREIETLITQDLFKETGKPTSSTADPVDSGNQTPVDDDVTLMNELGLLEGKEQSSSKTTDIAKETSDQATSPIEVVSTTPGNSENADDSISKGSSGQVQHPVCEKCSEGISIGFTKDTVFLSCKHVVHYDCIDNPHKKCPTCPAEDLESFPVEQASSTTQKKRSREDSNEQSASTSGKKAKKTKKPVDRDQSPTLQRLIKELTTDPEDEEILQTEPASESNDDSNIFLNLYNKIVAGEDQLKKTTQEVLRHYFDFGEAMKKRYDHYRLNHEDLASQSLVEDDVQKQLPKDISEEALRKRIERAQKVYGLFSSIKGRVMIGRIKTFSLSSITALSKEDIKYVIVKVLRG